MKHRAFSREELAAAFDGFEQTVAHAAEKKNWELDNPMVDPGDGTIISATNISIVTYAGDGQWCRQEDIYNPLRFLQAGIKWFKKAEALGTLDDDAARWMQVYGGTYGGAQ